MDLKKTLGEELYNQVQEKIGDGKALFVHDAGTKVDVIDGNYIPKDKFNEVNNSLKEHKARLDDVNTELKTFKTKVGENEELQQKVAALTEANDKLKKDTDERIAKQDFDFKLTEALREGGAKNPAAVKALLNTDSLKLDGTKILGLDDQLTALKESDSYLFGEIKATSDVTPAPSNDKKATGNNPWAKETFNLTEQMKIQKNDPDKAASLKVAAGVS